MDAVATVFRRGFCGPSAVRESSKLYLFPILMRQFVSQLLCFLTFCATTLAALMIFSMLSQRCESMFFANRSTQGQTIFRLPEYRKTARLRKIDILHLGSSTCYRGVDPHAYEDYGLNGFNLCSSSQSISVSLELLRWSLQFENTPGVVVLDIFPSLWSSNGIEATRDIIVNDPAPLEWPFLKMALRTRDIYMVLMTAYFGLKDYFIPDRSRPTPHFYKGHGFSYAGVPRNEHQKPCEEELQQMSPHQYNSLRKIHKVCKNEGIALLLLIPPNLCSTEHNLPLAFTDVTLINGNTWMKEGADSLFIDNHHLRGVGAAIYSTWLAKEVVDKIKN